MLGRASRPGPRTSATRTPGSRSRPTRTYCRPARSELAVQLTKPSTTTPNSMTAWRRPDHSRDGRNGRSGPVYISFEAEVDEEAAPVVGVPLDSGGEGLDLFLGAEPPDPLLVLFRA